MEQNILVTSEMSAEKQDQNVTTRNSATCSPASLGDVAGKKLIPPKEDHSYHKCIVCFKEFKRIYSLKDHMSVHTGVPSATWLRRQKIRRKCMVCEKMFVSPCALKDHMNVHTGVYSHVCEICGKKFFHRLSLKFHRFTHSTDRPHKCKFCTSTFKRPDNLTRHVLAVHEKMREIKCSDCNRYYLPYNGGEMRHAKKYHVGENYRIDEKPFKCNLCDAEFTKSCLLRTHSLIHMEAEKVSVECKICQKMVKVTAMYIHMRCHDEKKFLCCFCGKRFSLKHQVTTHEKSHLGLKAHACDVCDKTFTLPHQLRAHKKTHSGTKKQK